MEKTSMSVREMGRLLGLGKTDSYWLIKKNYFEIRLVAGKMRVMVDSFEKWYAGQFHYKKVNGDVPGTKWADSMSVPEMAKLLGIKDGSAYSLIYRKHFQSVKTTTINDIIRIDKTSFEEWYAKQTHYKKVAERREDCNV